MIGYITCSKIKWVKLQLKSLTIRESDCGERLLYGVCKIWFHKVSINA